MQGDFGEFLTVLLSRSLRQSAFESGSPFPSWFCESLMRPDPCDHLDCAGRLSASSGIPQDAETIGSCCQGDAARTLAEGVPLYPLHKQLSEVICEYVFNGRFRAKPAISELMEDTTRSDRVALWLEKVGEYGCALKEVLVRYRLHVQDEFLVLLRDGSKVVEGRCATGIYKRIQSGDSLLFNDELLLQVTDVKSYKSFYEMLEVEGLDKVLPGVCTLDEGVQVYRRFYSEEIEKEGVLAIHVARSMVSEPVKRLSALLQDLQVEGVMFLLGLRFTTGTVVPALPPSRSELLSSFLASNSDSSSASKLTIGGRALAKHVHRSSTGWWGEFTGTEMRKNQVALDVIRRVINSACWMNVHYLPHSLSVYEIRVSDGYGARWSSDGTQFRGFLEPPMKEGHALKWRH